MVLKNTHSKLLQGALYFTGISGLEINLIRSYNFKLALQEQPEDDDDLESENEKGKDNMTYSILPPLPSRRGSLMFGAQASDWPVTAQIFQSCFPFHIIFDKDLIIRHMGISLTRLLPHAMEKPISDFFELNRPPVDFTYANICSYAHNLFVLNIKRGKKQLPVQGGDGPSLVT